MTLTKMLSLATAVLILAFSPQGAAPSDAWISGTVIECWEGRPKPVSDLRVYVLTMEESPKIRDVLHKIETLPAHDGAVDVQAFDRLYDELIADVKSLGEPSGLLRTDKAGHFLAKHLRSKQKYLVLAIDWDKEDPDELGYYRYQYVELGASGRREVEIYMGPGKKTDCRGDA